jgi:predicted aldo/keto reductase-like oxidoreductase
VWNQPQVNVVLSGMSDEQQLAENIRIASDAGSNTLTEDENALFERVKTLILEKTKVPCTGCGYCLPCPAGVNIPGCFSSLNDRYILGDKSYKIKYLQNHAVQAKPSYASLCKECGKCEQHCPQHIEIRKELKNVKKEMEGILFKPMASIARKVLRVK